MSVNEACGKSTLNAQLEKKSTNKDHSIYHVQSLLLFLSALQFQDGSGLWRDNQS